MPTADRAPKLLFLVAEDWAFVSHRIGLAVAAKEAGYDVAVATRVTKAGEIIRDAGLRLIPIEFSRSSIALGTEFKTLLSLIRLYREEVPDIVHHVALKPVVYGSIAARVAGLHGVVNALIGLGYVFSSSEPKARALRPLIRRLLRTSLNTPNSRLIVQNMDDYALFTGEQLISADRVRLIRGSGVDPTRYPQCDPVGTGIPVVVLPARMLRDKGVLEFVEAARRLRSKGVNARFVLCGEPDPLNPASLSDAQLQSFVEEGVVEYWGWQNDMRKVWKAANIACLPSYREGLPKALLEAAASGLPLIAADVPGCREITRPGVNGWLVPARDANALADALHEAITREDLRVRYGARAREIVESELSLAMVVKRTLNLYQELAASAPPPHRQ
jgi:glycosyltransferase involved in cell wall biosynthesis